jgi:hypothetical protein
VRYLDTTDGECRKRLIDGLLVRLRDGVPATLIGGPRAVGKTTSAARLASTVVRLDRPEESGIFMADPDAGLQGLSEPVLLDEWQVVRPKCSERLNAASMQTHTQDGSSSLSFCKMIRPPFAKALGQRLQND